MVCVGEEGERGQRDTPTPTRTHCTPTTHNAQRTNAQHTTQNTQGDRQFCLPKICHVGLSLGSRGSPKKPLDLKHFQFENRSRTTCPRFLQSSALPDKAVLSFSNLEGSSGGSQQPDGSISLSPSPLSLPSPPQQHTTRNTQRQRHRHRDKTKVSRTICLGPSTMVSCFCKHLL